MFRYPFGFLWIVFAVLWIFSPDTLGHVYTWLTGLPLILEILFWIVFLPWVGALYIWHSSLALWLTIVIIVLIAMVSTGGASARRKGRQRTWTRSVHS
jgi:hypothetical protein